MDYVAVSRWKDSEVIQVSEPMTKEAAARIQSAAAKSGADPAFAIRAQAAADRREAVTPPAPKRK
jgi:hypothetical protein